MRDFRNILAENGLKSTPFRIELLELFQLQEKPLTASQILKSLSQRKKRAEFDRATLFRNLKVLVEKGLLDETEFGTGAAYYSLAQVNHHQHHLFCMKCESAEPLDYCGISPLISRAKEKGFQVMKHRLELIGLCAKCA